MGPTVILRMIIIYNGHSKRRMAQPNILDATRILPIEHCVMVRPHLDTLRILARRHARITNILQCKLEDGASVTTTMTMLLGMARLADAQHPKWERNGETIYSSTRCRIILPSKVYRVKNIWTEEVRIVRIHSSRMEILWMISFSNG